MSEKVFCKKCKYYSVESSIAYYTEVEFRDSDRKVQSGTPICTHDIITKSTVVSTPVERHIEKNYTVNNPYVLNANNDCPFFEKYKFWSL